MAAIKRANKIWSAVRCLAVLNILLFQLYYIIAFNFFCLGCSVDIYCVFFFLLFSLSISVVFLIGDLLFFYLERNCDATHTDHTGGGILFQTAAAAA